MTLPQRDDGYIVLDDDWNAHVAAINANTRKNADQDAWIGQHTQEHAALVQRVDAVEATNTDQDGRLDSTAASVDTLGSRVTVVEDDVTALDSRVDALESSGSAGYTPTVVDDTVLYGDIISSHTRTNCPHGESLSNGYMTAAATRSAKTFTATEFRFAVGRAAANGGTFDIKVYTGSSLSALQERRSVFGGSYITSPGVKRITLPDLAITAGDYVAFCAIVTGWGTVPQLASTLAVSTSGAANWINETPYSVYEGGRTYPPPSSLDLYASNWTRANQLFWFALA